MARFLGWLGRFAIVGLAVCGAVAIAVRCLPSGYRTRGALLTKTPDGTTDGLSLDACRLGPHGDIFLIDSENSTEHGTEHSSRTLTLTLHPDGGATASFRDLLVPEAHCRTFEVHRMPGHARASQESLFGYARLDCEQAGTRLEATAWFEDCVGPK